MGPNTITVPLAARARTDEELLERALTVARRTALGVLGDPEAAADVAQDVAVIVLRRSRFLKDPDRLDAWLHRVAVRAALRERKRGRRRRELEDSLTPSARHRPPTPASAASWICSKASPPVSAPR